VDPGPEAEVPDRFPRQVHVLGVGALCFIDADWPLIGAAVHHPRHPRRRPNRLTALLTAVSAGPVDVRAIQHLLANAFPIA
jgi:hypothetical protein